MRRFMQLILCSAALALACALHYQLGILADVRNMTPAAILGGEVWSIVSWLVLLCLFVLEISLIAAVVRKK